MTLFEIGIGIGGLVVGYLGVPVVKTVVNTVVADVKGLFGAAKTATPPSSGTTTVSGAPPTVQK